MGTYAHKNKEADWDYIRETVFDGMMDQGIKWMPTSKSLGKKFDTYIKRMSVTVTEIRNKLDLYNMGEYKELVKDGRYRIAGQALKDPIMLRDARAKYPCIKTRTTEELILWFESRGHQVVCLENGQIFESFMEKKATDQCVAWYENKRKK